MANTPIFGAPDDWSMLMSSHDIAHQTLPINDYRALYGSFEQQDMICSYLVTNHDTHVNNAHVASFGHESWPNTDFMAEASLSYSCQADHAETSLSHSFGDSGITCAHYGPPMDNNPNYPISISLTPADDVTDVKHHDIAQPGYQFAHNSTAKLGLEYFDLPPMVSVAACHSYNSDEHNFFSSNAAMDWKHIRSQHVRPLFCIFHYAGCMLRFASKNEWKRHILYQHLNLQYWVCTEGTCGRKERSQTETCALPMPTRGSIFNRKDLYTQHIRRMHLVHGEADTKARMRQLQVKAARTRCTLPDFMLCPVPECPSKFVDSNAWDNWMEHVAAHMQRGAAGEHVLVGFGGPENWTLTNWAASEAVAITRQTSAGTWTLRRPIHGRGACKMDV
ncbi:C2H2 finger domain protein, putative [Cordyceps militaris CM01]|uniref:C2H2 finger domain protein, putative n=1 Tax=Cordyceps militaris (strain CM01) TaxID=983644 RepID=G3JPH4_CORMM|nr:C2H2 finger domain protein, putative [Cordyceps militaris CM01]EGX89784.1 C2H2 finger domain protein, putative [Cordyceps militaris CM01]